MDPVNPNPQQPQLGPAMDPAFTQALLAALSQNQGLDTLKFLQQSGMTRNVQSSPRNLGGAENPTLQQMTDGPNPFFRSESDRQARIASSPASQAPSLLSSSSPDFQSRFGGLNARPTPQPALGSAENPFQGPNGSRIVALPNGSLGVGGLPNMPGPNMQGNEDLAPFMENANGVFANPQSYPGALTQGAAMDAQDLRQGHIQGLLRGMLANTQQPAGAQSAAPVMSDGQMGQSAKSGYSLEDLADGPQSGGTIPPAAPQAAAPQAAPAGGGLTLPVPKAPSPFLQDVGNAGNWLGNNFMNPIAEYFTGTRLPNNSFTGMFGEAMNELQQGDPLDALMSLFGKKGQPQPR